MLFACMIPETILEELFCLRKSTAELAQSVLAMVQSHFAMSYFRDIIKLKLYKQV